jgi:hypothetical protein
MVTRLANILRYSLQRNRNHKVPLETEFEVVVRLTRLIKGRESQSQVQPLLQEHVIVSLVRGCYSHAVAWS